MNDEHLTSLRDEYSKLFSLIETYLTMPYSVIPLGVAIIGALTLYGSSGKNSVLGQGLCGVVICYGMVLLIVWQSYVHTFVCSIGVRLVELECLINIRTGVGPNLKEGLCYFSSRVGAGYRSPPWLTLTTVVVTIFSLLVFFVAAVLGWYDLHERFGISVVSSCLILGFPLVLMILLLINIWSAENWSRKRREQVLAEFARRNAELGVSR